MPNFYWLTVEILKNCFYFNFFCYLNTIYLK